MAPSVPLDIYTQRISFTALAASSPSFATHLKPNNQLDFTNPASILALTLALLQRDFNLSLTLPSTRLCPPVPNRFNYILFIRSILFSTSPYFKDGFDPERSVLGIDIGTGASAIYPLLGCRQHPRWRFLCTEIDDLSKSYAQANIDANDLSNRIKIIDTDPTSSELIPIEGVEKFKQIDFLMTNPPFYSSKDEMETSAKMKGRPANSACTGGEREMIYPYPASPESLPPNQNQNPQAYDIGGEVAFVSQLMLESMRPELKNKIQWFTTMLGKLSSLSTLIQILKGLNCANYAVTQLLQGSKTRRWVLAWSWQSYLPPTHLARGVESLEKKLLPFPSEYTFDVNENGNDGGGNREEAGRQIDGVLEELEDEDEEGRLRWLWKEKVGAGLGMASEDCWSRKARRRKKTNSEMKDRDDEDGDAGTDEEGKEPALVFKITLTNAPSTTTKKEKVIVTIRWLQGSSAILFESFCGWLRRKIQSQSQSQQPQPQ